MARKPAKPKSPASRIARVLEGDFRAREGYDGEFPVMRAGAQISPSDPSNGKPIQPKGKGQLSALSPKVRRLVAALSGPTISHEQVEPFLDTKMVREENFIPTLTATGIGKKARRLLFLIHKVRTAREKRDLGPVRLQFKRPNIIENLSWLKAIHKALQPDDWRKPLIAVAIRCHRNSY